MCQPRNKNILRTGVSSAEKKKLSLARMTCLADKTNHPVERLSLNRSQCGSCSTKYDTSADTEVVYNGFGASTLLNGCSGKASALQALAQVPESGMEAEAYPSPHKKDAQQ